MGRTLLRDTLDRLSAAANGLGDEPGPVVYLGEAGGSTGLDLRDTALCCTGTEELKEALRSIDEWVLVVSACHLSRQRTGDLLERLRRAPEAAQTTVTLQLAVSRHPEREWLVTTSPDTGDVATLLAPSQVSRPHDEEELSHERIETNNAAAGSLLARGEALRELLASTHAGSDLFDSLMHALEAGSHRITAGLVPGYHRPIRTAEDLLEGFHDVLDGRVLPWPGLDDTSNPVQICPDASVHPTSSLSGTCWVGEGVRIEENCTLRNCVILAGARVGPGAKLKNTLVRAGGNVLEGHEALDKYLKIL